MSTDEQKQASELLLFLLPESLVIPEITDVRPFSSKLGDTEEEIQEIERLAQTIIQEGQIQPIEVRPASNGHEGYEVVAGRRRTKAAIHINLGKQKGEEPFRLRAIVRTDPKPISDPKAFRHAMIENIHRKGLSPMDMAHDVRIIREKFNWDGAKGTKKVAEYLQVSPAQVSTHEKLLELPEEVQVRIHKGTMSAQAGFELAGVGQVKGPDVVTEVLKDADQRAESEREFVEPGHTVAVIDVIGSGDEEPIKKKAKGTKQKSGKGGGTAAKHVKAAIRAQVPELGGRRNLKDVRDWFETQDGPGNGHADGAIRVFVRYFIDKWLAGDGTDRTLDKHFSAMVVGADEGTPPIEPTKPGEGPVKGKTFPKKLLKKPKSKK